MSKELRSAVQYQRELSNSARLEGLASNGKFKKEYSDILLPHVDKITLMLWSKHKSAIDRHLLRVKTNRKQTEDAFLTGCDQLFKMLYRFNKNKLTGTIDLRCDEVNYVGVAEEVSSDNDRSDYIISKKKNKVDDENGYIYVIKAGNHYKIGRSKTQNDRVKSYSTHNPHPIEVIINKQVAGYKNLEVELHEMFKEQRVKGEWFELNQDHLELISWYFDGCPKEKTPKLLQWT